MILLQTLQMRKLNSVTMVGKHICIYMFTDLRLNVDVVNLLSNNTDSLQHNFCHCISIFPTFSYFRKTKKEQVFIFKPKRQAMFMKTLLQMRAIDCEKYYNFLMGIWANIDRIYFCMKDKEECWVKSFSML